MTDSTNYTSLEAKLFERYGPLVGGKDLVQAAGFQTAEALKMAIKRKHLTFATFSLPGRRGKFAKTEDVARWLVSIGPQKDQATES